MKGKEEVGTSTESQNLKGGYMLLAEEELTEEEVEEDLWEPVSDVAVKDREDMNDECPEYMNVRRQEVKTNATQATKSMVGDNVFEVQQEQGGNLMFRRVLLKLELLPKDKDPW